MPTSLHQWCIHFPAMCLAFLGAKLQWKHGLRRCAERCCSLTHIIHLLSLQAQPHIDRCRLVWVVGITFPMYPTMRSTRSLSLITTTRAAQFCVRGCHCAANNAPCSCCRTAHDCKFSQRMRGCCSLSPSPECCRHVTTTCMASSQMPSVTQQCKPLAVSCSTLLVVSAPGQSLCDMFSYSLEHVAGQRIMSLKPLHVPTDLLRRSMLPLL
jgi:hypothetical protein